MLKLKDDLGDLEKVKAESKELNKTVETQETELEKLRRLQEETQTEKGIVEEELQSVVKARAEVCSSHYIVFYFIRSMKESSNYEVYLYSFLGLF